MVAIVFMLAGMSSRFGGSPKALSRVGPNNETLLEISLLQALKQPFSKIIFITNPLTKQLFVNEMQYSFKSIPIEYVEQVYDKTKRSRPWGTTDAVCSLLGKVEEPFILLNGDDLYGEKAFDNGYQLLVNSKKNIMGTVPIYKTIHDDSKVNRGVVYVDPENKKVTQLKECLDISRLTHPELMSELGSVNFIGLQPNILTYLNDILVEFKEKNKGDAKIEALLPNDLNTLIEKGISIFEYFVIEDTIKSLTYQSDIETMKDFLIKH